MAARHSKRSWSTKERETRFFHKDVRNLKKWCEKNNIHLMSFNDANSYDICVLAPFEFDIGEPKSNIEESSETYFLNSEDYEKWLEQN